MTDPAVTHCMLAQTSSLALGSPQFSDPQLARLARSQGVLAAWRAALATHGRQAACDVSGDFAVGLHTPERCFLAVDRFAIRTLCYRVDNGELRFAARADELADTATEIDPQAIFDYLYFHVIPSPRTIYKGIYRLPPGHCALFEQGRLSVAPYWAPSFEEPRAVSFDALKDEFRHLLREAVATQIGDDSPACFLSGGTDSSTVTGMAALASGRTPATYSIGFAQAGYDEVAFARIAARHFKTDHHEYYVTPADLVRSIPEVAAHFDQPFGNSSALPAYYCARMARARGARKLLAGDGGDELFGGNTRYAKQKVFGWYDGMPGALRSALLEPMAQFPGMHRVPLASKAASYVNQARLGMPGRLMSYNLLEHLGVPQVLTPALLAQVDTQDPTRQQHAVWTQAATGSRLNQHLAFDWRYTLAENDLPKVLGATKLAGVEVGFPLLDHRLLAFSQKLPPDYKLKGLQLRWFFKAALRDFLPEAVIAKKKHGFGLPFGVWANSHPGLAALARESLHSLAARGVVRTDFVQALLTQRLPEHPGYYGEMVWILLMLEQWLQTKAPRFQLPSA